MDDLSLDPVARALQCFESLLSGGYTSDNSRADVLNVLDSLKVFLDPRVHNFEIHIDQAKALIPYLKKSKLFKRAVDKPRGYAGDFETILHMYVNSPIGEGSFGRLVDEYLLEMESPKAVRYRRKLLVWKIVSILEKFGREIEILSIGSGPATELMDISSTDHADFCNFTTIDFDHDANAFVRDNLNKKAKINQIEDNVFRVSRTMKTNKYNLIYSLVLFDYVDDRAFVLLLNWIYRIAAPQSEIIIGNFKCHHCDHGFFRLADWNLVLRDETQLADLAVQAGAPKESVDVRADPTNTQLLLHIRSDCGGG